MGTAASALKSLQIYQLRGIEGPLSVELVPTGVTLVYGENGSGKSSICDAIEFGLREIATRCFADAGITKGVLELHAGGYGGTPSIVGGRIGPLGDLDGLLNAGMSGPLLAGAAGRALEHLADKLSKSLRVAVVRKEREDYTIGDLWPPVKELLSQSSFWDTQMEKLERAQFLRNKLGSHYVSWGDGISDSEVADAARLVRHAWELLSCDQCGKVVKKESGNRRIVSGCPHAR